MLVTVTAEDIKNGMSHPKYCPIALALNRVGFKRVKVNETEIRLGECVIPTSKVMQRFIDRFDHGQPVQPTRFRIKSCLSQ